MLQFLLHRLNGGASAHRTVVSAAIRFMHDGGADIIDPDNPLQHATSSQSPTPLRSTDAALHHHFTDIKQSVHNLARCIEREIDEETKLRATANADGSPSPFFPADAHNTDYAWKCQHVIGSRWLRLHRLWNEAVEAGADESLEEHSIDIPLPSLDQQFDENQQDMHATGHHPFTLCIHNRSKGTSIELTMDIVNNEIVLDSVFPTQKIPENPRADTRSMPEPAASGDGPFDIAHDAASRNFVQKHLNFQGPCLTESVYDSHTSSRDAASPIDNELLALKRKVQNRIMSFLRVRGLLHSEHEKVTTKGVVMHEKWSRWVSEQIHSHEQKEYDRWLTSMRNFVD